MAKQQFAQLKAAAIDGRTRAPYYRHDQLRRLHDALVTKASTIIDAIVADAGIKRSEAQVEYSLALAELREHYTALNPKTELEKEYSIANGQDAADQRVGAGIVYIKVAHAHSLFFSVVAPLSAAIAAGNCVLVQLENSLQTLPTLLKGILKEALDSDTFDVAQQPVQDAAFLDQCLQVIQDGSVQTPGTQNQLISRANATTAAIIDRSADLDSAAKALINARCAFKAGSPYAPDIVLVNEFIKKDFLQALVRHSLSTSDEAAKTSNLHSLVSELQNSSAARIVTQHASSAVLDIPQRSSTLLTRKIREPCLLVHGVRSLDDAIDFLNSNNSERPLLAAYHWGHPKQCKYLAQFIAAQVSFVNHIPIQILVGPAFPSPHPVTLTLRYPAPLFSSPAPSFSSALDPSTPARTAQSALQAPSSTERAVALRRLYADALKELPTEKRTQKSRAGFGFFEQAMLFNLGWVLGSGVAVLVGGVWVVRHRRGLF